jgi:hypothetical protein
MPIMPIIDAYYAYSFLYLKRAHDALFVFYLKSQVPHSVLTMPVLPLIPHSALMMSVPVASTGRAYSVPGGFHGQQDAAGPHSQGCGGRGERGAGITAVSHLSPARAPLGHAHKASGHNRQTDVPRGTFNMC